MVSLQLLILLSVGLFGYFQTIWEGDKSYLSSLIFATYLLSTALIGFWHLVKDPNKHIEEKLKLGWFTAESLLALGMIGTVIGFLILLSTAFNEVNVNDPASLKQMLTVMANGMGTSLYTTLTGLVCSLFVKGQLVNLELTVAHHAQRITQDEQSK